jgi:phenylpropionate dioxygenase-like ring-hydroxylating dioxygenase large terminal subunit
MFVKNAWYVAGWSHEVGREPVERWITGDPIVLFRTEDGRAVAMEDRCPHRLAPLSKGKLVGDAIQCGYHGMTYGPDGGCVRLPGQKVIPKAAKVRTYPLVDKFGWLWIWMGDPTAADETQIPDFFWLDHPEWKPVCGTLHCKSNYFLLIDNLLDLSHEAFLHASTIGNAAVAEATWETEATDATVQIRRRMPDCPPPPLFKKARDFPGNIDRTQVIDFTPPCYVVVDARGVPAGTNDMENGIEWRVINALVPEFEGSTYYYWAVSRHFAQDNAELDDLMYKGTVHTFGEDIEMTEAQQKRMSHPTADPKYITIKADAGPIAARKIISRMVEAERQAAA